MPYGTPVLPGGSVRSVTGDTLSAQLRTRLRHDRPLPFVTFYDQTSGERAELSVASYDNAVAKTANLLRDGLGLQRGAAVGVRLPLHWQLTVVWGACLQLGATLAVGSDGFDADVLVVGPADLDLAGRAPDTLAVSLRPFGMPFDAALPPGVLDHALEARAHGDVFTPGPDATADDVALVLPDGTALSQRETLTAARELAERSGLPVGGRLLTARGPDTADGLLAALAVPIAVSGSVVLVAAGDPATAVSRLSEVARTEHAETILGP